MKVYFNHQLYILVISMASLWPTGKSEEESILDNAIVSGSDLRVDSHHDPQQLIGDGFKSYAFSGSSSHPADTNELKIDLQKPTSLKAVFILNIC